MHGTQWCILLETTLKYVWRRTMLRILGLLVHWYLPVTRLWLHHKCKGAHLFKLLCSLLICCAHTCLPTMQRVTHACLDAGCCCHCHC